MIAFNPMQSLRIVLTRPYTLRAMSSSGPGKRKAVDRPISPPPVKRKVHTSTTSSAVQNFFTPTSQKPKDRTTWSQRGPSEDSLQTLLVANYLPENHASSTPYGPRKKIAAFDLDSTLIKTASGKTHATEAHDWNWWHPTVPVILRRLYHEEGYLLVLLSNQGGLTIDFDKNYKGPTAQVKKRVAMFKQKVGAVLTDLNLPVTLYAATGKDVYRKPRPGMWDEMCADNEFAPGEIDMKNTFFVGDAAGRIATTNPLAKADFSCSDRNFAFNVGILNFQTPEEYFLKEKPRKWERGFDIQTHPYEDLALAEVQFEKKFQQEIVIFVGSPGSGKSTIYDRVLKPLGYERVNQDILKTREKCVKVADSFLLEGKSVAVDNTNADPQTRQTWLSLAVKHSLPVRALHLKTPMSICEHNNVVRALNAPLNPENRDLVPKLAFNGFASRFKPPSVQEGFIEVIEVEWKFRGTKDDYEIWGRYWV